MFKSTFSKQSKTGVVHEAIDIANKNFLLDSSFFICGEASPFAIEMHVHEEMEVSYIEEGEFACTIGDNKYILEAGDVYIVQSNIPHALKNLSVNGKFFNLIFKLELLNSRFLDACELKYVMPLTTNRIVFDKVIRHDPEIVAIIKSIIIEKQEAGVGYELFVKGFTCSLIAQLYRKYQASSMQITHANRNLSYSKIEKALLYIEQNFCDLISVEIMSEQCNMTKSNFCKMFKKVTGKTFTDYVNYTRIREAVSLLENTNSKTTDIAKAVGFEDVNYFSRMFKKYIMTSPSNYRKTKHK